MFCEVAKYHVANIFANASTNIYTKNNCQFLTIFALNLTILPKNSIVFLLFSFVAKLKCFVKLWSVRVQTFVPRHQEMYILKIFSYFS